MSTSDTFPTIFLSNHFLQFNAVSLIQHGVIDDVLPRAKMASVSKTCTGCQIRLEKSDAKAAISVKYSSGRVSMGHPLGGELSHARHDKYQVMLIWP